MSRFPVVRKRPQGHVSSSPGYIYNGHWGAIKSFSPVLGRSESVAAALQSRLNLRNMVFNGKGSLFRKIPTTEHSLPLPTTHPTEVDQEKSVHKECLDYGSEFWMSDVLDHIPRVFPFRDSCGGGLI